MLNWLHFMLLFCPPTNHLSTWRESWKRAAAGLILGRDAFVEVVAEGAERSEDNRSVADRLTPKYSGLAARVGFGKTCPRTTGGLAHGAGLKCTAFARQRAIPAKF